jgi:5-methylthioadenosine/S-adenosylhomocysteine deaminase
VLNDSNLLDSNLLAAHIHDTTTEERKTLVEKGVQMVGCPSSISMIDGIIPPICDYHRLGGIVSIGTDQAPGPGHHNMFKEMRMASLLSKIKHKDPTALPAWDSLRIATIGGAKALGIGEKVGTLEVGKFADIIMINKNNVNLIPSVNIPFRNFIPNLVYSSTGNEVENVIINGELVLQNGKFVKIDENAIIREASSRAESIFRDSEIDWENANSKLVEFHKQGLI